jgi:hypothetical protein
MSEILSTFEALVDAACATDKVPELKKLQQRLEQLDLVEASDEPGALQVIDRVFAKLDARIAKLDAASEASRVMQSIRDAVTSS